ncbi:Gfo/Idh/MocA family protein [Clostridium grantii]|uniref:Predicted dehydrogenase n=1 Tax=Clostridium grantii DSM 8605 TaxID=1121316 RepID=A0A1M5V602_9CLOT|nr:Gfo/Idh/MocA family oxidoreductase [Clostridium grantii]SHH70679.1 Predicted dehydrogenase [Clostridium grantii DSM 8605]
MTANFILIGYGWRTEYFYRVVKALPEQFTISAAVLRTKERAEEIAKEKNIFATENLEEALKTNPDFVVLCVPRAIVKEYLEKLMEKNIPVLCETPPAKDVDELNQLWQIKEKYNGRIQIAEQYFLQPLYSAWLKVIQKGFIGDVSNMTLSALHGYHAVSIFRKILGIQYENCKISGKKYMFNVTKTNSRVGIDRSGTMIESDRSLATIEFENGKVGFLDFSGEQYFSLIRTRRLNIQGVRGEINDMTIRYLSEKNIGVTEELKRLDYGIYNISDWSHQGIMLGSEFVYENPFQFARLNDDEIAIADCLKRMKHFVDTGEEFYSLKEALQDTYISFIMEKALESEETLETQPQTWI